ncbi:MAG: hypothetical protein V3R93_06470, partial [Candidatus Hydrothermarchaeaceae archaeon]
PLSPMLFALASYVTGLDIATFSSRIVPFFEAATPLSIYFLARYLYNERAAVIATLVLAMTPSFVFWSGISDPQSFTLFLIPLLVLFWIWHSRQGLTMGSKNLLSASNMRLLAIGAILAVNFLMHLSYFLEVIILLMVTLALVINREANKRLFLDFLKVVLISQALTAFWWLPKNLYWWWINGLVTSSGMYGAVRHLSEYGVVAAILGIASFLYIAHGYVLRRRPQHLIIILWALPLFFETQNEGIIAMLTKINPDWYNTLEWSTLGKPLEGFRFYCFLAQPLSIAAGVMVAELVDIADKYRRPMGFAVVILLIFGLAWGLQEYRYAEKFQTSGLTPHEYEAAQWYREHSAPSDRIIADYYRAQMFGAVNGGRALLGGMFPLRNVDYPYIKAPGQVQNDLYTLYKTESAEEASMLAKRYGATHIFYSDNMVRYGNLLSYLKPATRYGVDIDRAKFNEAEFFEFVYREDSMYGEVVIVRVK